MVNTNKNKNKNTINIVIIIISSLIIIASIVAIVFMISKKEEDDVNIAGDANIDNTGSNLTGNTENQNQANNIEVLTGVENDEIWIETDTYENNIIKFAYNDGYIPGSSYDLEINTNTKNIDITVTHHSSAADAEPPVPEKYNVELTDEEFMKIIKLYNVRHEDIGSVLESFGKGDNTMSSIGDVGFREENDINNDGVITYKEFGASFLNSIIDWIEAEEGMTEEELDEWGM